MRYILIILLIYIVYRIAKAVMLRKLREMSGAGHSRVREKDSVQSENRNIEDAKFTEVDEDDPKSKE